MYPKRKKQKRKPKKLRPVNIGLGGHSFSQQSFRESDRFSSTLSAGLPSNTATPSVSEFIRQQRIQRVRDRFPELNLPMISEEPPLGGVAPERYRMDIPTRIRGRVRPELDEEADRMEGLQIPTSGLARGESDFNPPTSGLARGESDFNPPSRTVSGTGLNPTTDPDFAEIYADMEREGAIIQEQNEALREEIVQERDRIEELEDNIERLEFEAEAIRTDPTGQLPAGAYRVGYEGDLEDASDISTETSLPRATYSGFSPTGGVEATMFEETSTVPSDYSTTQFDGSVGSEGSEITGHRASIASRRERRPPVGLYQVDPKTGAVVTFGRTLDSVPTRRSLAQRYFTRNLGGASPLRSED